MTAVTVPPAWSADVLAAHALADVADRASLAEYRSIELRTTHKVDGTPVSQIDLDVERAMLARLAATMPADAVIGEEIGAHDGTTGRRWILDGIDGTHNYTDGKPGWATIVALEVDGVVEVGLLSAPALGRRWWAERGCGAWTSAAVERRFDPAAAEPITCGKRAALAGAAVLVVPWPGFLIGWRHDVAVHFAPPEQPRSQCLALDAAMVASGAVDAAVLTLGGIWDFAATSVIITEAGGVFRDAWGGERLTTTTGVYTNAAMLDELLAEVATIRPAEPDRPVVARTVSTPLAADGEGALDTWRRFGIRHMQSMSARSHVDHAPPVVLDIVDERLDCLREPFRGVTADGVLRSGLRALDDAPRCDTASIVDAAQTFLTALSGEQRQRASFDIDAHEWREWINVHMNHFRHGLMLEDLTPGVRELALGIVRATMSARGYHHARSIMRLNELLAEITGDREAFGEWPYFMSIFGTPGGDAPWGWQFDGHHVCINTLVLDGRIVMTPTFMGAEPRRVQEGPLAGIWLFEPEERLGLDLIRAFDGAQRERAVIYPSIHPDHLPTNLSNLFDGRMQAGAAHDNLVAPYQGVAGADMTDAQRRVLSALAASYVGWAGDDHAAVKLAEVERHLDETWFSWYGGFDDEAAFYYRVHSPVIMIEFDHHPGVALDNEQPSRHHVHSVVRTPHGGDYGRDLLAQHHERFDHRHGRHDGW